MLDIVYYAHILFSALNDVNKYLFINFNLLYIWHIQNIIQIGIFAYTIEQTHCLSETIKGHFAQVSPKKLQMQVKKLEENYTGVMIIYYEIKLIQSQCIAYEILKGLLRSNGGLYWTQISVGGSFNLFSRWNLFFIL